jgi:hypothetical protein
MSFVELLMTKPSHVKNQDTRDENALLVAACETKNLARREKDARDENIPHVAACETGNSRSSQ